MTCFVDMSVWYTGLWHMQMLTIQWSAETANMLSWQHGWLFNDAAVEAGQCAFFNYSNSRRYLRWAIFSCQDVIDEENLHEPSAWIQMSTPQLVELCCIHFDYNETCHTNSSPLLYSFCVRFHFLNVSNVNMCLCFFLLSSLLFLFLRCRFGVCYLPRSHCNITWIISVGGYLLHHAVDTGHWQCCEYTPTHPYSHGLK